VSPELVAPSVAALAAIVAVIAAVVATLLVRKATGQAVDAADFADQAQRHAGRAASRARAMAEHRVPLEALLQEWGLRPRRAAQMAAEIRDRVAQEVAVQGRVDGAQTMTSERAERFRLPRDGGPQVGPEGTQRG